MPDERVTAIVLRPRGDASLMNAAGLEPGDRLVGVNGRAVTDVDVSALASELEAGGTASLDIDRAGETRTVEVRFEEE